MEKPLDIREETEWPSSRSLHTVAIFVDVEKLKTVETVKIVLPIPSKCFKYDACAQKVASHYFPWNLPDSRRNGARAAAPKITSLVLGARMT